MGEGIEGAEGKAMGSREEEDYRKGNMTKGKGERRGRRGRKGKGAGAPPQDLFVRRRRRPRPLAFVITAIILF